MSAFPFPASALERLSNRILKGDVVFFIGSGASMDSERNDGKRLMARLLVRLLALADELEACRPGAGKPIREDFVRTFSLKGTTSKEIAQEPENIEKLQGRYYEANEWFCIAFGYLLAEANDVCDTNHLPESVRGYEETLRGYLAKPDPVPLDSIAPDLIKLAGEPDVLSRRAAGKALFLDSMGFCNLAIMGGKPSKSVPFRELERSYDGLLLPRHHVLARFAREGLCPTTLTTNFDLLIEGAFRLAGFRDPALPSTLPQTLISDFEIIASPEDFFTKGKAYREAIIVKMHGCAQRYRDIHCDAAQLRGYLPSMVFTYREIQNWRTDSWAADYLRTLLRTRVVVFCGYSLQDPVIHDTFRTVYEEMARVRAKPTDATEEDAPAFFFAPAGGTPEPREFHGKAVLHAAASAVGASQSDPSKHRNYIPFHYRSAPEFPNFDELMRWLFHLTYRKRQEECLKSDLRRITTLLLGGSRPESELAAVRKAFQELYAEEVKRSKGWTEDMKSRQEHTETCGWTETFHVGLLREFACGDVVRQRQGTGIDLGLMRRLGWYYPAMQDASWTCWAVVVELALRAMARQTGAHLIVGESRRPTVLVQRSSGGGTPHAITIQFGGFERTGLNSRLLGCPMRRIFWELGLGDAPWRRSLDASPSETPAPDSKSSRPPSRLVLRAPDAMQIWRWAAMPAAVSDTGEANRILGFTF